MELGVVIELLKQAYMEQNWEAVLECINLLSNFDENGQIKVEAQDEDF